MFDYSCKDVAEELKETVRNSLQHHNDYTLHIIFVTPVPGGVGLLTTATLMKNVIDLYDKWKGC